VTGTGGISGASGSSGGASGNGGLRLLQNLQFDTGTDGWVASFGSTISRSSMDAANSAQSGSLDLILDAGDPTISVEAAASQCVSATGGTTYALSVSVLIPSSSPSAGALGVWFFNSTDCSGSIAGAASTPSSATNAWQKLTGSGQAPSGAQSMAVRLKVVKSIGQTAAEALFDAVAVSAQ
jgi:hypothetical protein